jgi:adenine-specific DNA methylase
LRNTGESNYIIELLDKDANIVDLLVNEIGVYDGTKAIRIPAAGEYTFNVESSGSWIVDVLQPGAAELAQNVSLPQTFTDQGPHHTVFFTAKTGALRLTLQHTGSSNFIVELLDAQGRLVDLAANEIGPYQGTKVVRIPANGIYLFTVEADGAWTIESTQ